MPGELLHQGAMVTCVHFGNAMPTVINPRVKVSGQPIVLQSSLYTIAGCPNPLPPTGPCLTAQWITGALRIKSNSLPVLLKDSQAICIPTGTGLTVQVVQPRVKGQ